MRILILCDDRIEHSIGDLIAEFIGMSFGYRFGSK